MKNIMSAKEMTSLQNINIRFLLLTLLLTSCQSTQEERSLSSIKGQNQEELDLSLPQSLENLTQTGPYDVQVSTNIPLSISVRDHVMADFFEAKSRNKKPILIISHGNKSSKESHFEQAKQIASWGIHVITVSFPNTRQWLQNGTRLLKVSNIVAKTPWIFSPSIDANKIIIAGHSFGGSATAIAMGSGAPAIGAILLDPALYSKSVIKKIRNINKPMILIGADRAVFRSRERTVFYNETKGPMYEISIKNAHHDDAQNPSIRQVANIFSFDALTDGDRQKLFAAAITLSALSLSENGGLQEAWNIMARSAKTNQSLVANRFKDAKSNKNLSWLNQNPPHTGNRPRNRNIQ